MPFVTYALILVAAAVFLPWQGDLGTLHNAAMASPWITFFATWAVVLFMFCWGWKRWGDRLEALDRAIGAE